MKTKNFWMVLLPCLFLSACNKTGKHLTANGWKTDVYEMAIYGADSVYLDASLTFFTFEKEGLGGRGTVNLIGKGDCFFKVSDVRNQYGDYFVNADGQKARALMSRFSTFKASGKWTVDGETVKIAWSTDSTIISSGSNGTSTSNDFSCKNIGEDLQYMVYSWNKERIDNMYAELKPIFHSMFEKWLQDRTVFTFDPKEDAWISIDGKTPVMWELKLKSE